MATAKKNLSSIEGLKNAANLRVAVVYAEWNQEITYGLRDGCIQTLKAAGIKENNLSIIAVPGSFELPQMAAILAAKQHFDSIVCLGSVIRGETAHFDYVCQGVSLGIQTAAIKYEIPIIFGVLTDDNWQQAKDRSGGKHGNKGIEAAVTAIEMGLLRQKYKL